MGLSDVPARARFCQLTSGSMEQFWPQYWPDLRSMHLLVLRPLVQPIDDDGQRHLTVVT